MDPGSRRASLIADNISRYAVPVAHDRVPLYVRLPRAQVAALDRLVDATGQRKQQVVSELLGDRLEVGHAEVLDRAEPPGDTEILTLDELAELLRVDAASVLERAMRRGSPGAPVRIGVALRARGRARLARRRRGR